VDMNNGTIYDTSTQLSWLKNANTAGTMTWNQAVAWAASLNAGSGFAGLTIESNALTQQGGSL